MTTAPAMNDLNVKEKNRAIKMNKKLSGKSFKICNMCEYGEFCKKCKGYCVFSRNFLDYVAPSFKKMLNVKYYKCEVEMIEYLIENPHLQLDPEKNSKSNSSCDSEDQDTTISSESEESVDCLKKKAQRNKACSHKRNVKEESDDEKVKFDEGTFQKMADVLRKFSSMTNYAKKIVLEAHKGSPSSWISIGDANSTHRTRGFTRNIANKSLQHPRNEKDNKLNRKNKKEEIKGFYIDDIKMRLRPAESKSSNMNGIDFYSLLQTEESL